MIVKQAFRPQLINSCLLAFAQGQKQNHVFYMDAPGDYTHVGLSTTHKSRLRIPRLIKFAFRFFCFSESSSLMYYLR